MGFIRNVRRGIAQAALKMYVKGINGGQMLPISQDNKAVYKEWDAAAAIKEGYKSSVYVYKSIDKIGKAAASVPWKVYRLDKRGKWEPLEGHPLAALIEQPNPFMDRSQMIERMTAHLYLAGNALHSKVRGVGNSVLELWPIEPQYITPVASQADFISRYEFRKGALRYDLEPQDVIHSMFVDPENMYWGMGPLQVAAKTVDTDIEAVNWNKISLQNRAVPDGALIAQQALSRPQWEEARRQLREEKQGPNNARDLWILSGGMKFEQFGLSPIEMDFLNSRKMTREEICTAFDVPPPIVGIMDNSTYANMEEARRIFWEDTVIPYLNKIRQIFNMALLPDFQQGNETLYLDYDTSGVFALRANEETQSNTVKNYWSMGVPFNELNRRFDLGFDEIEGGDTGFIGSGLVPANLDFEALAMPPEPEPTPPDNEDDNEDEETEPPDPNAEQGDEDDEGKKSNGKAAAKNKKKAHKPTDLKAGINLVTDEQKALYWKSQERRRLSFYSKWTSQAKAAFKSEGDEMEAAYNKGGFAAVTKAITSSKNQKKWAAQYLSNYKAIVKEFGESAFNGVKNMAAAYNKKADEDEADDWTNFSFDPYDEEIQQYLVENAALKVAGVLDFTKQTIAAIIVDLEKEGANVDDIARAIKAQYTEFSRHRAFRIARTEVSAASNYGLYSAGQQAAETVGPVKKKWINSADDRVRDSHDFKEAVAMDEKFRNGLLYPGDMANGTAKEVIHCRCTLAYEMI